MTNIIDAALTTGAEALAADRPYFAEEKFRFALGLSADPARRARATVGIDEAFLRAGLLEEADALWKFELQHPFRIPQIEEGFVASAFRAGHFDLALRRIEEISSQLQANCVWTMRFGCFLGKLEMQEAHSMIDHAAEWLSAVDAERHRLQVLMAENRFKEILDRLQSGALKLTPNLLQMRIRALIGAGEFDRVERDLEAQKRFHPDQDWMDLELARNASEARWRDLALTRWEKLAAAEDILGARTRGYIEALLAISDIDRAEEVLASIGENEHSSMVRGLKSRLYSVGGEYDKGIAFLEEALSELDGVAGQHTLADIWTEISSLQLMQYECLGVRKWLDAHLISARKALEIEPNRPQHKIRLTDALIRHGDLEEAYQLAQELPVNNRPDTMRIAMWMRDHLGDNVGARRVWTMRKRLHYVPQVADGPRANLIRVDENPAPRPDSLTLYTAIRNESQRLPWFFDYYRRLGVENFIFVDNGSTDQSLDFLLKQPGVNVFSTTDSYFGGHAGMVWINFLKNRYSNKGWALYVDVDEALVYDGCAARSVPDLVELLESEGSEALPSFMLDMFNLDQTALTVSSEDIDYVTRYPFYLPKFHRNPKAGSPYSAIRGGVRTAFGTGEELTKTPLVKSASSIDFLQSSHHISPARISSYSSVLLHYKMIDGLVQEAKAALAEQKRSPHCLNRYRRYLEANNIADLIGESLENVKRYEGFEELVDLGLISRLPDRARSANP